jgi:ABC-2 type transport system permease protein
MTQATASRTGRAGALGWAGDSGVLIWRGVLHIVRNPEQLAVVVFLPMMLLLIFRYMFGGAIDVPGGYANYLIAGIIVIAVAFNATTTTVAVCNDRVEGLIERFRSMPMASTAVLAGHVVAGVVRNLISGLVVVGVGLVIGFRPQANLAEWLGVVGVLVLFAAAISWLAVLFGLLADTPEAATGLSLIIVFVPYASSAFVPPQTMPAVLRFVVDNQPVSPVIVTLRGLLLDQPIGNAWWLTLLWWVGVLVVVVPLAARVFRQRTAR